MISTPANSRISRLSEALVREGVDAFFAASPITMGYLQGFFEDGHERFLALGINTRGEVALICPALSAAQASRSGIENVFAWRDGEDPLPLFRELADRWQLKTGIIAVDDEMRASTLLDMQSVLPAALFKKGQSILSGLMRFKDDWELQQMKRAGEIADNALSGILRHVRPGISEAALQGVIAAEMSNLGGSPTFAIVAAGKYSAEPHHLGNETTIEEGDVVILDYGCSINGYQSDVTKTVACGSAPDEASKVYEIVLRAHDAARVGVRAGVTAGSVDALARRVIEDAGYGEYFVHRTGHGIGMRGHEEPYIVGSSEMELQPGDCFSVEPGIYMPGRFGVRIETIVSVTEDGYVSMNEDPHPTLRIV